MFFFCKAGETEQEPALPSFFFLQKCFFGIMAHEGFEPYVAALKVPYFKPIKLMGRVL